MSIVSSHILFYVKGLEFLRKTNLHLSPTLAFILVLNLMPSFNVAIGQDKASQEYQIKAAFLFNFAQFTNWPPSSFADSRSPLVVGILGDDPFGIFIDELVKGEKAGGRGIIVKRFDTVDEVKTVHILFISKSNQSPSSQVFDLADQESILTISDAEGFTSKGGMVKFFTENNKVRFEINLSTAKEAGIVFSSKVVRLAEICCN